MFYTWSTSQCGPASGAQEAHRTGHSGRQALSGGYFTSLPGFPLLPTLLPLPVCGCLRVWSSILLIGPHILPFEDLVHSQSPAHWAEGSTQRPFTIFTRCPVLPHPRLVPDQTHPHEAGFSAFLCALLVSQQLMFLLILSVTERSCCVSHKL